MTEQEKSMANHQVKAGLHLKRSCLLVADLARSLTLYKDILGFRLDYISEEASEDSYLYKVFKIPAEARLKFATLSTEHEARALALTEVKGVTLPPVTMPVTMPHHLGLVVQVSDVAEVVEQVRSLGLEVIEPSYFTAPPNLAFTEQGIVDFDGQLIVLYETKIREQSP